MKANRGRKNTVEYTKAHLLFLSLKNKKRRKEKPA